MPEIQQIFTKLSRWLVEVGSHNSESQNARFVAVRKGLYKKKAKGNFSQKSKKKKKRLSLLKR